MKEFAIYLFCFFVLITFLTFQSVYAQDAQSPQYSSNSTNSTIAGTAVMHSLLWQDNAGLSYAIFEFDNCTGSLQNISEMSLSGASAWSNFTVIINSTIGCTIRWKIYTNDTSNNWNASEIFSYTTISKGYVTVNTNTTEVWWGDGIKISGVAMQGEDPISSANLKAFLDEKICSTFTNETGHYSCQFTAPNAIGRYEILVSVTDPQTNENITNTTSFYVKIAYGESKESERIAKRISCMEMPKLIQNPDGSIQKVKVRVCVWR